jgi:hypothetical protein
MDFAVLAERSRSLRYAEMEWIFDKNWPTFVSPLLKQMPQYDVLEALHMSFSSTAPFFPDYSISLTRLHSLILDVCYEPTKDQIMGLIALWKLPSLVSLSLICKDEFTPAMELFFRSFGHNLTSLLLQETNSAVVPTIVGHCPSVQNLFIQFVPQETAPYTPFPPTPRLLRIQFVGEYIHTLNCDEFAKSVENKHMPNSPVLQYVQLSDVTRADGLSNRDPEVCRRWKVLGDQWLDKGIRFEDVNSVWFGGNGEIDVSEAPEGEREVFLRLRDG